MSSLLWYTIGGVKDTPCDLFDLPLLTYFDKLAKMVKLLFLELNALTYEVEEEEGEGELMSCC